MLILVSTGTGKQLGSIRIEGGKAVFEGAAEQIFRSRQRAAGEDLTDREVYDWYAEGWSNGALAIYPADAAATVEAPPVDDAKASPEAE